MSSPADASADTPLLIADDPVLDMLNTVANVNGQTHDFWQNDADVSDWLVRAGWLAEPVASRYPPGVLLAVARHLRGVIRSLVEARK
ncbi:ABATE domain-containing protein, partial [Ralstonia sp.]